MFTVEPIHSGTIESVPKGVLTYLVDGDISMDVPLFSFLVTADAPDDDRAILVDTGIEEPTDEMVAGREIEFGGPDPLLEALDERGLAPSDIDYVVLSHLHHDHAANNDLFPEARFFVQRAELEAALDPLPVMKRAYFTAHVEGLSTLDTKIVDGDHRLCEGIELLHAPGHTKGMQAVVVETAEGPLAIAIDLADCPHNLAPERTTIPDAHGNAVEVTRTSEEYLPPGLHVDVEQCYESIDRIVDRVGPTGTVLGGHDAEQIGERYP